MPLGPGTKLSPHEILALLGVLFETCLAHKLAFVERRERLICEHIREKVAA
jgi:hypothetical protein